MLIIQLMICVMKSSMKIVWKTKVTFSVSQTLLFFLGQKYILFSEAYFLRYVSAKASNAALVKFTDWIIRNDHMINCLMFFCKWFKYGQTSNVIWLSTAWLLISRLEVANKEPLFTTKPASIWIEISC